MRAGEIAAKLAQNAESVAAMLMPQGKRVGPEWEVGGIGGEVGHSLKIRLSGPKTGVWSDFATGASGDLLDLWVQARGLSVSEAMEQAREYLGVRPMALHGREPERVQIKAPRDARPADSAVMRWLTEVRKLPEEAVRRYRLAERKGELVLPAFDPEGGLQFVKYRSIAEKRFHSEPGGVACLFGWQAIPPNARTVVICEGELDAVAWSTVMPALSVTNGAGSLDWIEYEFDRLARFDTIYLSYDMDEAGQRNIEQIVDRLGRERCRVVSLPRKDANECLMAGDDLGACLEQAQSLDPPELRRVDDYRAETLAILAGGALKVGVELPWEHAQGFAFGASELTVVMGETGHGKSEITNFISLIAMRSGLRACVASLEFHPARWLRNVVRQAGTVSQPTEEYANAIMDWLSDRCWLYGKRGTVRADHLIEVFSYAARRYGCRWFVVDNLAKCGIAEDNYPAQKELADKLGDFANAHRAHVVLVAHTRKDAGAGVWAIKGSGGIADMADNVWRITRNRKQEERREREAQFGVPESNEEPDAWFRAEKVRDGETEPRIALWWHAESHQHIPTPTSRPVRFVNWTREDKSEIL